MRAYMREREGVSAPAPASVLAAARPSGPARPARSTTPRAPRGGRTRRGSDRACHRASPATRCRDFRRYAPSARRSAAPWRSPPTTTPHRRWRGRAPPPCRWRCRFLRAGCQLLPSKRAIPSEVAAQIAPSPPRATLQQSSLASPSASPQVTSCPCWKRTTPDSDANQVAPASNSTPLRSAGSGERLDGRRLAGLARTMLHAEAGLQIDLHRAVANVVAAAPRHTQTDPERARRRDRRERGLGRGPGRQLQRHARDRRPVVAPRHAPGDRRGR